jgi:hypothetical protein
MTQAELERRLQESGVRILIGELRDAPRVLQEWDLIEPDGQGYRFRVELLRRWIAERKPLARVQQEIDHIQPVAENLFQGAYGFYQDGQLEQALPLLRQVVGLNPNHQRGTLLLAEILLAQGQVDEASKLLENLYLYSPAAARPRLVQALLLQAQAQPQTDDARLAIYNHILEFEPEQPEARDGIRRIRERQGDTALAEGNFEQALAAYGESGNADKAVEAGSRRIEQLVRNEQYKPALDLALSLHEQFPEQRQHLPDLVLLERKSHLAELYSRALIALSEQPSEDAKKLLIEVIILDAGYREATRYLHLAVTGEDIAELRLNLQKESVLRVTGENRLQEELRAHSLAKNRADDLDKENQRLRNRVTEQDRELKSAKDRADDLDKGNQRLQTRVTEQDRKLKSAKDRADNLDEGNQQLRNRVTEQDRELKSAKDRADNLDVGNQRLRNRVTEQDRELKSAKDRADDLDKETQRLRNRVTEQDRELEFARKTAEKLDKRIQNAEKRAQTPDKTTSKPRFELQTASQPIHVSTTSGSTADGSLKSPTLSSIQLLELLLEEEQLQRTYRK